MAGVWNLVTFRWKRGRDHDEYVPENAKRKSIRITEGLDTYKREALITKADDKGRTWIAFKMDDPEEAEEFEQWAQAAQDRAPW